MDRVYRLWIALENAAFIPDEAAEVARILRKHADKVERDGLRSVALLHDVNGNSVGEATIDRMLLEERHLSREE